MKIIPVIDLMAGQVVRGVAGQRDQYLPNVSCLVAGSDPLKTVLAIRRNFRNDNLYVADLDALEGRELSLDVLSALVGTGLKLTVDAAVRDVDRAVKLFEIGVSEVVIPLESLQQWEELSEVSAGVDASRLRFSLDLKQGQLLGILGANQAPLDVIAHVVSQGIQKLIVLDLATVGTASGPSTLSLCRQIRCIAPTISLWTGGGIRTVAEIRESAAAGVEGVLLASAIHDGLLTPASLAGFSRT